jgi:hypothetical protein
MTIRCYKNNMILSLIIIKNALATNDFFITVVVNYQVVSERYPLHLKASCSKMRSRTIAAIIVSAYSFVTYTFAAPTATSYKFSFIHYDIITLLVF